MLSLLKRFVRYVFSRAAAFDRGWTRGWAVGYDSGYEEAKDTVLEWYEPEPPEPRQ